MEARTGGFHTGLDIRTMGRVGLPVRTPVGGSVVRARVSPEGYGKAIYLDIGDGRSLVFAHLHALADPIQARIAERQAATGEYAQQLYFEPGEIEFAAGDVIALAGDTGTGAPHLHLEVREGDVPINPIDFFEVPDTSPPVIRAVRVVPLIVDRSVHATEFTLPVEVSHGDTVRVRGPVGLQVEVEDRTGLNRFGLLPRHVELEAGEASYRVAFDRVSFDDRWRRGLVVEWDDAGRRWINLFSRPQREVSKRWQGDLRVDAPTEVRIRVRDDAGGAAATRIVLVSDDRDLAESERWADFVPADRSRGIVVAHGGLVWWSRTGHWGLNIRNVDGRMTGLLPNGSNLGWKPPADYDPSTGHSWFAARAPVSRLRSGQILSVVDGEEFPRDEREIVVSGSPRGGASFVATVGGNVRVYEPSPDDFSTDTVLRIFGVETDAPEGHDGLGSAFRVDAPGVAFRRGIDVGVTVPGDPSEYVLNARDRRGRWSPESGIRIDPDRQQAIRTRLVDTGIYRVVRDVTPPTLGPWRVNGDAVAEDVTLREKPDRIEHGITRPRWPAVVLDVADAIAGIDPEDVAVTVNGKPYPARPELEDDHVWLEWDVDPGPGKHDVVVEVADRLGNRASARLVVRLVESPR